MIPYEALHRLAGCIEEQYFADSGRHVRIRVRFACIEEGDHDDALRLLLGLLREQFGEEYLQTFRLLMDEAEISEADGRITFTLPNNGIYRTMQDDFLAAVTSRIRFWTERFTSAGMNYSEAEDLSESYAHERVYTADEHIARVLHNRQAEPGRARERKPADLVKRENELWEELDAVLGNDRGGFYGYY